MALNKPVQHPPRESDPPAPLSPDGPSDGRGVSIDKCVESLKDLFSSAAQLVQSLETRRRNKGWNVRFWSKKTLGGEARGLYNALIGGRASMQKAFETAQSVLIYALKSCRADNVVIDGLDYYHPPTQSSKLSLLMQNREEFRENVHKPLQLALNAESLPVVDFGEIKKATEDCLASILRHIS